MFKLGTEIFCIQTTCSVDKIKTTYLAKGYGEARATAVIASYVGELVYKLKNSKGLLLMEDIIDFDDFLEYLEINQIEVIVNDK